MWKLCCSQGSPHEPLATLNNFVGRSTWIYDPAAGTEAERARVQAARDRFVDLKNSLQNVKHSGDELLRLQLSHKLQPVQLPSEPLPRKGKVSLQRLQQHLRAGVNFLQSLQQDDGFWAADYGGPLFLFPAVVVAAYVMGKMRIVFSEERVLEALRYLRNHQNEDGGYGLHIEGESTMFGTCLNYVAFRILGVEADDPMASGARAWIHERGGATYCTSWGKFWLCVLGVYSWEGINPIPPEMWVLPHSAWTGIGLLHPGRMWCHCRMVYLPMGYLYGKRQELMKIPPTDLVMELRTELYLDDYNSISWDSCRNLCAKEDLYYPHSILQDALWWMLTKAEALFQRLPLRNRALAEVRKLIEYEDENTRFICIGPVNKVANMLCRWVDDPHSDAVKKHIARLSDYFWVAEDGLKMQGYNGSQLWDTAFAAQAICTSNLQSEFKTCLKKAYNYLEKTQVIQEVPGPLEKWYRHVSKGAWPFSNRDHGWPISDCTSEGLKAALMITNIDPQIVEEPISTERLFDSVNVILSYQNADGGMATYEQTRSYPFIEFFNPAETFGDIMIDYSYVECTSACSQALIAFSQRYPNHRTAEIQQCLLKARNFILRIQREDGSWYGSWGICFTYGCWFGLQALAAMGDSYRSSEPVRRACSFLLEVQKKNGGWGESYLSSQNKSYSQLAESHVVNTAWAMMALMHAKHHLVNPEPVNRAALYLMSKQNEEGDWPQQHISGVFNKNCMISYTNYRYLFPVWALGMYQREVLQSEE